MGFNSRVFKMGSGRPLRNYRTRCDPHNSERKSFESVSVFQWSKHQFCFKAAQKLEWLLFPSGCPMLFKGGGLFTLGFLLPLQCYCFVCRTWENKSRCLMQCLLWWFLLNANRSFYWRKFKFIRSNFQAFHQSWTSKLCIKTHFLKALDITADLMFIKQI